MNTNTQAIAEGSIIGYLLPETRRRIWRGRILRIIRESRCILVESTEPGYEGLTEYIMVHQVTAHEHGMDEVITPQSS